MQKNYENIKTAMKRKQKQNHKQTANRHKIKNLQKERANT